MPEDKKKPYFSESSEDATASYSGSIERPGTEIGPYKLLSVLGEGGFGIVYLAQQRSPIKRRVALKIVKPGMDSKQVLARFEAERQTLALLDHPNIAKVHDAGITKAGRPYFVMEHVKGTPITQYCDRHKLTIETRLRLFQDVCKAIQYAHQKGIIHRDIKPSNILISTEEDQCLPKVIDFGVAKAATQNLTERTLYTEIGQVIGTPEYMSPEQAEMSVEGIDTRSDIYSLAVVLYELLVGVLPFDPETLPGKGVDAMRRVILDEEPRTPSTRLTSLGEDAKRTAQQRQSDLASLARCLRRELEWIPLKAMRKDPERRYRSASEFADDIQNYLNRNPLIAGPEAISYKIRKFANRHAFPIFSAVTILLIIIGALLVTAILYAALKETAEKSRRALYASQISQAELAHQMDDIIHMRKTLPQCSTDLRGWEWQWLWHVSDQSSRTLQGHEDEVTCLAISPDGRLLVTGSLDKTVRLWDIATDSEMATLPVPAYNVTDVAFSPDGNSIAAACLFSRETKPIILWDADTGIRIAHFGVPPGVQSIAFSPGGKYIASGSAQGDNTIKLWEVATGNELPVAFECNGRVNDIEFSPDGSKLLSAHGDGCVRVWDANTGFQLMTLGKPGPKETNRVYTAKYSPDGKRIFSCSENINVWDVTSGDKILTLNEYSTKSTTLAISPDGTYIASCNFNGIFKVWNAYKGIELGRLRGHTQAGRAVFTPNGEKIVTCSGDKTVKIWDLPIVPSTTEMPLYHQAQVVSLASNPENTKLASACLDGTVRIWDTSTEDQETAFTGHTADARCVRFSPDGDCVVSGGDDMALRLWDPSTGVQLKILQGHNEAVKSVDWCVDGKLLVSGSNDDTIRLWDATSQKEVKVLNGHQDDVLAVAFIGRGQKLISASLDGAVKVWDTQTGSELRTLFGPHAKLSVLSKPVTASADGRFVAAVDGDFNVRIWNTANWRQIACLKGHRQHILGLMFCTGNKRLISAGVDAVKFWDIEGQVEILSAQGSLYGWTGWFHALAMSPNGRFFAVSSGGAGGIALRDAGSLSSVE